MARRADAELPTSLRPVSVQRLADSVVEQIRALIVVEGLGAGSRLPSERQLATQVGASRAVVAQALRTLSLMGLVEIRPGSGAYVTRNPGTMLSASVGLVVDVVPGSIAELAAFRLSLEELAAASPPGPGAVREVDEALAKLRDSVGATSAWISADTLFHSAVVRAAGNAYLSAVFDAVHAAVLAVNYEEWVRHEQVPRWLTGRSAESQIGLHAPIAAALREGDQPGLLLALRRHHVEMLRHLAQRDPGARG